VEHGSVMAGQSVGMVTQEEPAQAIIATLMAEAAQALERRAA
jgi:enoyl-[acyl-carrier protein] reductase II